MESKVKTYTSEITYFTEPPRLYEPRGPAAEITRWMTDVELHTAAIVVETPALQYIHVSEDYSVIYIPVKAKTIDQSTEATDNSIVVEIKAYPICNNQRKCITMPVMIDGMYGMSEMRGLTGKCVCLNCIQLAIGDAERQKKEVISYVNNELGRPVGIEVARGEAPGFILER